MGMCEFCYDYKETTGAVLAGVFGQACRLCRNKHSRLPSADAAQYHRDRDREDHLKDLIQPWTKDQKPNTEFIRNYPEQAKDYFTDEQLETYG